MASFLSKISALGRNKTTYAVGLLQTKAYRALKLHTMTALKPYDITTTEWAFLGMLNDEKEMRLIHAADELGVEAPFVTQMIAKLSDKKLLEVIPDESDSRAKKAILTKRGKAFVAEVEKYLKDKTKPLLKGIKVSDLLTYMAIMEAFLKNSGPQMPKDDEGWK